MFGSLGMPEILVILAIVALLFGPRQLPKLGKALGETIREFGNVRKEFDGIAKDAAETQRTLEREVRKL